MEDDGWCCLTESIWNRFHHIIELLSMMGRQLLPSSQYHGDSMITVWWGGGGWSQTSLATLSSYSIHQLRGCQVLGPLPRWSRGCQSCPSLIVGSLSASCWNTQTLDICVHALEWSMQVFYQRWLTEVRHQQSKFKTPWKICNPMGRGTM